ALIAELHRNGAAARGSSIRVNGVGQGRETFLEKGSPFLPRTPSILSKNFRVITFFASAKTVIALIAELHRNGVGATIATIKLVSKLVNK
ncbi:MAG: hypothetical protein J6C40_12925, partial [Lentisphaeria bacterium]|nr:hypothetical protein [Lentisphaeria bacterium]